MHTEINKFANSIYEEFKSDISEAGRKYLDRWAVVFNSFDNTTTQKSMYVVAGEIFHMGARYIRDDARWDEFRSMHHDFTDMIESWSQGNEND